MDDDLADLEDLLREHNSVSEIAEYLGPETVEVEAKIAEMRPVGFIVPAHPIAPLKVKSCLIDAQIVVCDERGLAVVERAGSSAAPAHRALHQGWRHIEQCHRN